MEFLEATLGSLVPGTPSCLLWVDMCRDTDLCRAASRSSRLSGLGSRRSVVYPD